MIPRIRPDSVRIKPSYAKAHHLGPVTSAQLKARIIATAELTRARGTR